MVSNRLADCAVPVVSLYEFAEAAFKRHANKLALVDGINGTSYTFAQVLAKVRQLAAGLARLGVRNGDIVGIHSPNNPEFIFMIYAIIANGAIATCIDTNYVVPEIVRQLHEFQVRWLYTHQSVAQTATESASQAINVQKVICLGDAPGTVPYRYIEVDDDSEFPESVPIDPKDDLAFIQSSSGTTGLPKGVMTTHYNVVAMVTAISQPEYASSPILPGGDERRVLAYVPFYANYGLIALTFIKLLQGNQLIILPKFSPPDQFLRTIERYRVNEVPLVPFVIQFLTKSPLVKQYDISSIKMVTSSAAPLKAEVEKEFKKLVKLSMLRQAYGMTESTSAISIQRLNSPPNMAKEGSSGQLMANVELQVVDLDTGKVLGHNEKGAIWLRGPTIFKGYWKNPKATKETVEPDGWMHTGDIGYYDEDGYIFIIDRLKELIKTKSFQVAPAELEAILFNHPCVEDVGVIGIPDARAGEVPKAYVVKKPGATIAEEELVKYVAGKVADYKQLRGGVEFVSALPRIQSGKLLRRELRKMAQKSKL